MLKSTGIKNKNKKKSNTAKYLQAKEEQECFPTFWVAHSQQGEFETNQMRVLLDKSV